MAVGLGKMPGLPAGRRGRRKGYERNMKKYFIYSEQFIFSGGTDQQFSNQLSPTQPEENMKEICFPIPRQWDLEKFRAIMRGGGRGEGFEKYEFKGRGREKRHGTCQNSELPPRPWDLEKFRASCSFEYSLSAKHPVKRGARCPILTVSSIKALGLGEIPSFPLGSGTWKNSDLSPSI